MTAPVLNGKQRSVVLSSLEEQGAVVRRAKTGPETWVVSTDLGVATISLNTSSFRDIQNIRSHLRKIGLDWPLDAGAKPRLKTRPAPVEQVASHATPPESVIERNDMSPTVKVERIDPNIAERFLSTMKNNRKLSSGLVTRLAKMMQTNLWVYDGSPIRFNLDGELVDGQHRLWAIIEADFETNFLVVRGVERAAMATMDTGKSRSFSDILNLEDPNLTSVKALAATVGIVYRWEDGRRGAALSSSGRGNAGVVPNATLLDFFRTNRERLIEVTMSATGRHRIRGISGAATALALWVFEEIDAADAEFFFEKLKTGAALEEGNPILALRNYISRSLLGQNTRTTIAADLSVALLIKTWNAYREGNSVKVLSYRRGGSNPEAFPIPQ